MAQWLRTHLPMQETWVQSLLWKIPHATQQLSPCATTSEPVLDGLGDATTEPLRPIDCALQQEKPLQ